MELGFDVLTQRSIFPAGRNGLPPHATATATRSDWQWRELDVWHRRSVLVGKWIGGVLDNEMERQGYNYVAEMPMRLAAGKLLAPGLIFPFL